jgi:putative acetyltransferase
MVACLPAVPFSVTVRREIPADHADVRRVNELAFMQPAEADLVDALRAAGAATLSLVAVHEGRVMGHILFSPVTVASPSGDFVAVGLAPMAVLPELQKQGVGSLLVRAGLNELRHAGHEVVVVLGHPGYYPRFGFARAGAHGIRWEHDAPDEAFMVLELRPSALRGRGGVVRYRPEFDAV